MPRYEKGEHVKIEVTDEVTGESEWIWLLIGNCDDDARIVCGRVDNEPIVNTDMRLGQELAVSFDKVRDHGTS